MRFTHLRRSLILLALLPFLGGVEGCDPTGLLVPPVADSTVGDSTVSDTTVSDSTVADTTVSDTTVADTTVSDTTVADTAGVITTPDSATLALLAGGQLASIVADQFTAFYDRSSAILLSARIGVSSGGDAGYLLQGGTCTDLVESGVDSTGHVIDADHDLIPDDYAVTFGAHCTWTDPDHLFAFQVMGRYRIEDLPQGVGGWRVTTDSLRWIIVHVPDGYTQDYDSDGEESLVVAAGEATYALHALVGGRFHGGASGAFDGHHWTALTTTAVADPGASWSLGAPIQPGTLSMSGTSRWQNGWPGYGPRDDTFIISTPEPLHFDFTGCGITPFTSGRLRAELQGSEGTSAEWHWTACGVPEPVLAGFRH